jgi:hypothetical protein
MMAAALGVAAVLIFAASGIFEPTKRDPFSGWAAVRSIGSVALAAAVLLAAM